MENPRKTAPHVMQAIQASMGNANVTRPHTLVAFENGSRMAAQSKIESPSTIQMMAPHVQAAIVIRPEWNTQAGIQAVQPHLNRVAQPSRKGQSPKKPKNQQHKTKSGNIKKSTYKYLKSNKVTLKEVAKVLDQVHGVFDELAKDETSPPLNTTRPNSGWPKVLYLNSLGRLGVLLRQAIQSNKIGDRGVHLNTEGKLPIYNNQSPYTEHSAVGKGGRLVIDSISGRKYISAHYSIFFRVV